MKNPACTAVKLEEEDAATAVASFVFRQIGSSAGGVTRYHAPPGCPVAG
jgi:hypothetical protein